MPPAFSTLTDAVSGPMFLRVAPTGQFAPMHQSIVPVIVVGIWACGFAVLVFGWMREWMRVRTIVLSATPLPFDFPIPVLSTPVRLEPGVFGILKPVLLLPEDILNRLPDAQLQGVFAHELSHVRRRDNLTAAINMLAEALFWFYPLLWWLGSRLMDERERACDEEVLQLGGEPQAYAEVILNVCKSYLESPVACVSGISGSNLKERIVRIISKQTAHKLTLTRKLTLTATAVAVVAGPLGYGLANARQILRQPQTQWEAVAGGKRAFEFISVKASAASSRTQSTVGLGDLDDRLTNGGLLSAVKFPLSAYIEFAYKLTPFQTQFVESQLPKWTNTRFDIEGRADGNPTTDQMRLMMQSLLADRFQLVVHFETRELPVYALDLTEPGKTGPRLQPHSDDPPCSYEAIPPPAAGSEPTPRTRVGGFAPTCGALLGFDLPPNAPTRFQIEGRNLTVAQIASHMPVIGRLDREVLDNTRLNGNFDFSIVFAPEPGSFPRGHFRLDPSVPKLPEALQQQLGLRLDPETGLVNVLVIDHIEQPSTN